MNIRKLMTIAVTCAAAFFFAPGSVCTAGQSAGEKTTIHDVRQEVKETLEVIGNYSAGQREEVLDKVKAAMDALDARIDRLEDRVAEKWNRMDQAARDEMRSNLKTLRKKRNELAEWYGGMQHSSAKAWQRVKKGLMDSYEALSEAYTKAVKEF